MATLTTKQVESVKALAAELGVKEQGLLDEAQALADEAPPADAQDPAPGKADAAAPDKPGQESAVDAHGGRGYFAYEYPFLTVNEVRESLFLDSAPDGEMFTGEWLKKHGGGQGAPPAPAAQ